MHRCSLFFLLRNGTYCPLTLGEVRRDAGAGTATRLGGLCSPLHVVWRQGIGCFPLVLSETSCACRMEVTHCHRYASESQQRSCIIVCVTVDYRFPGDANGDGINGDGAITQKRFAIARGWRRSVRGRLWPGKNFSGRSLLLPQIAWTTFCLKPPAHSCALSHNSITESSSNTHSSHATTSSSSATRAAQPTAQLPQHNSASQTQKSDLSGQFR